MITAPPMAVRERCERMVHLLHSGSVEAEVVDTTASVGAGAFPTHEVPSYGLALAGDAQTLERALRSGEPPVIGHVTGDRLILDLRSVPEAYDAEMTSAVLRAIG
jgi:L-seryl-tRNA(Ser) seleniumtransferase